MAIEQHACLAEDLGARVLRLRDADSAAALARVARDKRITLLVICRSRTSWWTKFSAGSMVTRLLWVVPDTDVHLVTWRDEENGAHR